MTGAVLLSVGLLFLAASIEYLLESWRDLRRALRGLADDPRKEKP